MSQFKVAVELDGREIPEFNHAAEMFITALVASHLKGLVASRLELGDLALGFTDDPARRIPLSMSAPRPVAVFLTFRDDLAKAVHSTISEILQDDGRPGL